MTTTELEPDPQLLIGPVFEDAYSLFSDQMPATQPYEMYVTGEGTSFENAEAVTAVIETFLTDLQYIEIDGYGSRTVQLNVWVTADSDRMLARAENDLMRQLYKPTLLWWRPPRHDAPWSVFEVATSGLQIAPLGDNDFEEATFWRKYTISLTCGAWVRGTTEETASMPSGGSESIILNTGTVAGVSVDQAVETEVTFDDSSGDLVATLAAKPSPYDRVAGIKFSGYAIDPTVTPMLVVEAQTTSAPGPSILTVQARGTGGAIQNLNLSSVVALPGGWFRYYYKLKDAPAGVIWNSIVYTYTWTGSYTLVISFRQLSVTDAAGSIGSLRQKMFDLDVKGSVVARGAIEVGNDDPLGTALVYSFSDPTEGNYMPVLTPWRFPLSTATWGLDANMASGHINQATAGQRCVYSIPLDTLPDGTYDLVMKGRGTGVGGAIVSVDFEVNQGGLIVFAQPRVETGIGENSGVQLYYNLGQVSLPLLRTHADGTDATLDISIRNAAALANTFQWDDCYLLNVDTGAYTILTSLGLTSSSPSAAEPNFLSLESPSFEWPAQSIMVGVRDDPPTYYTPNGVKIFALGRHELEPGRNRVLVVTDAVDSEATARYYPRGHTNMEW